MKNSKNNNITTLSELEDRIIGKEGTLERDKYEFELQMDVLGETIKQLRQERKLTQEELGKLIGVQKSTISKLENKASNVTINTLQKVFKALDTNAKLQIELENKSVELS